MSDQNSSRNNQGQQKTSEAYGNGVPEKVSIEGDLPLTSIDIESQKDMESGRYHPIRSLDKWFAARPTPATRLSVIASAYPDDIDSDELLRLMQIGPKEQDEDIAEYVERKFRRKSTDKSRNENFDEYYGYPNPNTRSPTESELKTLHDTVREAWDGESPTILDPTAGRGIIPFEAARYGFNIIANEYNPVPALINKVVLEYAPEVGSITPEIHDWTEKIIERTRERTAEYYPTKEPDRVILNSAMTYIIICESCGGEVPLVGKWWLNKTSDGGDSVRPHYEDGEVTYEHVKVQNHDDFDPSEAPVSYGGDAECPHCAVTVSSDNIREKFTQENFEYSVYGVNYKSDSGKTAFRAGSETDQAALRKAKKRIESDFEMLDFFSEQIPSGKKTNEAQNYGMNQWRDIYTPRQLVTHYELYQTINNLKEDIFDSHAEQEAELILSLIAMAVDRQLQYNCRLAQWLDLRGYGSYVFSNNNFSIKRMFVDNNICADRRGLERQFKHVINDSYEIIAEFADDFTQPGELYQGDAASLTDNVNGDTADIAVVDPPYFDSIMYGELSGLSYLNEKYILGDVFPGLFSTKTVRNEDQAVANPARHDDPERFYENKMKDIFDELREVLVDDGVLTLMFTDREVQAWNTISKAVIESGFTITASHPVKTEMSDRVGAQDTASVNSSILLVARNRSDKSAESVLWENISSDIEQTAREEALRLLAIDNIDKIETSIAAFGPALEQYSEAYPVEDKHDEKVEPKRVLAKARQEVTNVIVNDELNAETDSIDGLTRWYILCYTIYNEANIPFDEANQLGMGTDVEITELKRSTKIWSKSSGDVSIKNHTDRVQDIVKLRDERADNPSSRKYPINPTNTTFTYAIDAVHAALHVYDREGPQFTRDWLAERGFKNNTAFTTTIKALLEAAPSDIDMHDTLTDLVSGETGDYLDISVSGLNITDSNETQTGFEQFN